MSQAKLPGTSLGELPSEKQKQKNQNKSCSGISLKAMKKKYERKFFSPFVYNSIIHKSQTLTSIEHIIKKEGPE